MIAAMLTGCDGAPGSSSLPEGIDHLIYAVADLENGMDEIERLLGVRPIAGGRHPDYGTHNALLSLGPTTYLEIMAPDPDLPRPGRGLLFDMDNVKESRLARWVLRSEAIQDAVAAAASAGLDLGTVQSGSRRKPDGSVLAWQLTDPYAMPLGGAVPFLISWGETRHPAKAAPRAGELIGLRIEHPDPDTVLQALEALGVEVDVSAGDTLRIVATIRTAGGEVELH